MVFHLISPNTIHISNNMHTAVAKCLSDQLKMNLTNKYTNHQDLFSLHIIGRKIRKMERLNFDRGRDRFKGPGSHPVQHFPPTLPPIWRSSDVMT